MLREITIKNFKSICEEQTFSMEAFVKRINEHPDHITSINGVPLLRIASIYGPNGGGKSNLLEAIILVKNLFRAFPYPLIPQETPNFECLFSGSKNVEESIYFVTSEYEIGYHFSVSCKLSSTHEGDERIAGKVKFKAPRDTYFFRHESLDFRKKSQQQFTNLFSRNMDGTIESTFFSDISNVIKDLSLTGNMSFMSYIMDYYGNEKSKQKGIIEFEIIFSFFKEINKIRYSSKYGDYDFLLGFSDDTCAFAKEHKEGLISFLNNVGIDVCDITFENEKRYTAETEKIVFYHNHKSGKKFRLSLNEESSGTKRLFYLYIDVIKAIEKESILIVDDLDVKLHPVLLKHIIRAFLESSKDKDTQLIFNSHDIINMTPEIFRRDEIWFAFKENLSSKYISLASIINYRGDPVRNDAIFYKQYLEGKYGNDPFIEQGFNFYGKKE